jgi:hypothetical protein
MPSFSDYKPFPVDMPVRDVLAARSRLVQYFKDQFLDIDVRPQTVAGDLMITPAAYLETAIEKGVDAMLADMNPDNMRSGNILFPEVASKILAMFGAPTTPEVPSYAVVRILSSRNLATRLEAPVNFTFNGEVFLPMYASRGAVAIGPDGAAGYQYTFHPVAQGLFAAYIPVVGPAGTQVSRGQAGTLEFEDALDHIQGVDIERLISGGLLEETISRRAQRAFASFARPGFSTRENMRSYLARAYPWVTRSFVSGSGDAEMSRVSGNILGIKIPTTDIYVRSVGTFTPFTETIPLKYNGSDPDNPQWVGGLAAPYGVSIFDRLATHQENNIENKRDLVHLYAKAYGVDDAPIKYSYSMTERYAIAVRDFRPEYDTPATSEGAAFTINSRDYTVSPSGSFHGDMFDSITAVDLELSFNEYRLETFGDDQRWVIYFRVWDKISESGGTIAFVGNDIYDGQNPADQPTGFVCSKDWAAQVPRDIVQETYRKFFAGMTHVLARGGSSINRDDIFSMEFTLQHSARSAWFNVSYRYDPAVLILSNRSEDFDFTSSQNTLVRGFSISQITNLSLQVSAIPGVRVDRAALRAAVARFFNNLPADYTFQASDIFNVIAPLGITGIDSVKPTLLHHTTPADYLVSPNYQINPAPKSVHTQISDIPSTSGFTKRNRTYYLDPDDVVLTIRDDELA